MNIENSNLLQPLVGTHQALRYHYLDNLRAMAMMLGIFIHVALSSIPLLNETYLFSDTQKSLVLEAIVLFVHLFYMPLFMFIAGFFAHCLMERRGIAGFIKNRSLRVLIPFIIFLPIILTAVMGIVYYAAIHAEHKPLMLRYIIDSFTDPTKQKDMPLVTAHLWFLYYLVMFYIGTCILVKFRLFSIGQWLQVQSPKVFYIIILLILPLILIPSFYLQGVQPLPAPEKLCPQWWALGLFGVFFFLGWSFFGNDKLLNYLKDLWKPLLTLSLAAYIVVFFLYPKTGTIAESLNPAEFSFSTTKHVIIAVLEAFITTYVTLTLLSVGQHYLNQQNNTLRYIADSSYWAYLIHLPIVMFTQLLLLDKEWNVWLKFSSATITTFIICIVTYQVLVRHTPIGWLLNGKK
jgi:glucans biosynthesis protein C